MSDPVMRRSEEHTCHARGCDKKVVPAMFMCRRHWFALPKSMRDEVWDVYVPGQEDRMDPTDEYIEVTQRIIDWLAKKEGASMSEPTLCGQCGNWIVWLNGAWWHDAPAFSAAPMALSPFAAQLDADHEPLPVEPAEKAATHNQDDAGDGG